MATMYGVVKASGSKGWGSKGWTSRKLASGRYYIDTDKLPHVPTVVVTGFRTDGSTAPRDNVVCVENASREGFEVRTRDVEGTSHGKDQNAGFSFMLFSNSSD